MLTRPTGLLLWLLNAPGLLFRLRLGWLLGNRFLMLTHRGRRSGRLYSTVLEVVRYDASKRESLVMAGWGERSDWYRNLKANGAISIDIGGRRYRPALRFLTSAEVYSEMQEYVRRYPHATRIAYRLFGLRFDGTDLNTPDAGRLAGVAFSPED